MLLRSLRIQNQCIKNIFVQSSDKFKCNALHVKGISISTTRCTLYDTQYSESIGKLRAMDPNLQIRDDPVVAKLDSPDFKSIFTKNVVTLADMFKKYKYDIRIAGGAVRDLLMNKRPSDLDFATTATPQEMVAMFNAEKVRMFNTNGISHGTVTARINDKENFEVTTLRIDVKTDGRHAEVAFTKNWVLDASRRDLTINSMYLGLDGSVYDWFHGYEDLQHKRVAFVGKAHERIQEDYLRILRYFRFYGRIAEVPDNHDKDILATITENMAGLQQISGERIWGELQKILRGNFAIDLLRKMFECQIAKYMGLPENVDYDELARLQNATKGSFKDIEYHPVTILATQLNDPQDAIKLQSRLKTSAYERDLAAFLAENKLKYRDVDELLPYQKKIVLTSSNQAIVKEYLLELLKYNDKRNLYDQLLAWRIARMPVVSSHLAEKGVDPGKKMGLILQRLRVIWCDHNLQISTAELLNHLPEILNDLEEKRKSPSSWDKTSKKRNKCK